MRTFTNQELNLLYRFQEARRRLALLQNQAAASPWQAEIDALSSRWKSLYSGRISSPKELEQLQKKSSEYKKARAVREDKLLEQLLHLEELEKQAQLVQEQAVELKTKLEKLEAEETARVNALRAQSKQVEEELAALEKDLPAELMTYYQRSAGTLKGSVLAPVKDGTCGSCHMILSPAVIEKVKAGGLLTLCENCGRGLFIPETTV